MEMKRICVFCGSSTGFRKEYAEAAEALGKALAGRGCGLVYGAGGVGLMKVLADAALEAGGEVIGVIPQVLYDMEVAHQGLTELKVVSTMHERKALMAELSSGFIALPGGVGTLEELVEMLTWSQLGIHRKPCGLLDVQEYFRPLLSWLERAVTEGFLKEEHGAMLQVASGVEELLDRLETCRIPTVKKYIDLKIV